MPRINWADPYVYFNGHKYTKKSGRRYYTAQLWDKQLKRTFADSLHRAIWRQHNGDIPAGYHIHHKDGNWDNNDISNLECLSPKDHFKHHPNFNQSGTPFTNKEHRAKAQEALRRWFAANKDTPEFQAMARERAKKAWASMPYKKCTCTHCGGEFESRNYRPPKFCCSDCAAKYARQNGRKYPAPQKERICQNCGCTFIGPRRRKACGNACQQVLRRACVRSKRSGAA